MTNVRKCPHCKKAYFPVDGESKCPHCGKDPVGIPDSLKDIFGGFDK